MDYLVADDRFHSILEEVGVAFFGTAQATAFPETYKSMFGFCVKMNSLKLALFDLVDSQNPYAFKGLYRCYCEHYLRFTYIFVRFAKEHSDDVGVEFVRYCGASELREYAKAVTVAEELLGNRVVADLDKLFGKYYPDLAGVSKSQLEARSAQFRYREILRFLSREMPAALRKETPFLARIVPTYARLSPFVHGGPSTERETHSFDKPESVDECREDAGLVFVMTASAFMLTAMVVSREFPEYGSLSGRIHTVIREYLGTGDREA